jgi:nicotinate-nucleotide adenylyltransferase
MLALAVTGKSSWAVDFRELERGGRSYTAITLESLRTQYSRDAFFLIMGSDSLASFDQWQRSQDILAMAQLAVIPRGGRREASSTWGGPRVHILRAAPLNISSTTLRDLLARGRSIEGLVPKAVMSYIVRQELYAAPEGRRERR